MKKMIFVILGLAFLALGILGITGWVPMFRTDLIYVNIGEIILGILGLSVGVYSRQGTGSNVQTTALYQQKREIDQQRKEIDQQKKQNDQRGEENIKR